MGRPNMRPVRVNTVDQQDLKSMHRIRDEIKSHRIAKASQIRSPVDEYGQVAPQQLPALRRAIPRLVGKGRQWSHLLVQTAVARIVGRLLCAGLADDRAGSIDCRDCLMTGSYHSL
jgi:transposase